VKVRIVQAPQGIVDGIRIDLFHTGLTYDLAAPLATLLICEGYAEPAEGFLDRRRPYQSLPQSAHSADRRRPS